jgi:hypothetical protein
VKKPSRVALSKRSGMMVSNFIHRELFQKRRSFSERRFCILGETKRRGPVIFSS